MTAALLPQPQPALATASLLAASGLGAAAASLLAAAASLSQQAALTMWQHFFSQPQAFSQQAGFAAGRRSRSRSKRACAQQAGSRGTASGLRTASRFRSTAGLHRTAGLASTAVLAGNRSFRPQNRSRTGVTRWQQVFSQPQAFAQQAGFGQQAGSGAQHSPLNPRLQRATLNSSAPNIILVLIEQQLLYNELSVLLPLAATSNAECPCRGAIRRARRVLPWVRTDSGVFAGRCSGGKAGKLHQFARFRRQRPSNHSMARNVPDSVSDAPSQRATAARAIR